MDDKTKQEVLKLLQEQKEYLENALQKFTDKIEEIKKEAVKEAEKEDNANADQEAEDLLKQI